MGTVRYTVVNGIVMSEDRGGVERDYLTDGQGNTLALLDSNQTKTDTFAYFPSGTVAARTGTTQTPFQWVGGQGYFTDSPTRKYVRARHYHNNLARWNSQDPIGFRGGDYNLYRYVNNRFMIMVDPSGLVDIDVTNNKAWRFGNTPGTSMGKPYGPPCCGLLMAYWTLKPHGKVTKCKQNAGYIAQYINVIQNDVKLCSDGTVVPSDCHGYIELFPVNLKKDGSLSGNAPVDGFTQKYNDNQPQATCGHFNMSGEAKFFCTENVPTDGITTGKSGKCGSWTGGLDYFLIVNGVLPDWWNAEMDDGDVSASHNGTAIWNCCPAKSTLDCGNDITPGHSRTNATPNKGAVKNLTC